MVAMDLFLTTLYVLVNDFIRTQPIGIRRGPMGKLTHSEAVTLLIFSQWSRFRSVKRFRPLCRTTAYPILSQLPISTAIEPTVPASP